MAEPLRVGVVGAGRWGTNIATQFRDNSRAAVTALSDIADRNREKAGERLGVDSAHRYENYEAMLEGEPLDAVQITSPHELHYEHTLAALDRNLHVLCEKPFVPGIDRAAELTREIEASDRVVMVGFQRHVHPAYTAVRNAIAAGDIEPNLVTAEITQSWIESVAGTWRVEPELSGGGQLYDTGSHLLDAVVWMLGRRPERVSAEMEFYDDAGRVDVQATLSVRLENDTVANIAVSGDASSIHERIVVQGDQRRAVLTGTGWDYRGVEITDAEGETHTAVDGDLSSYDKVDGFLRAVAADETPPATARDAFYATALTEAAYEAARSGERVSVRQYRHADGGRAGRSPD